MALTPAERQRNYRERHKAVALRDNGNGIEKQRGRPPAIATELGHTGLKQNAGQIYEEFLPSIRTNNQRIKIYTEMANNDAIISGFLFAINSVLTAVDWHVEPERPDDAEDVAAAKFVSECLRDLDDTWPSDVISEILSMLTYGWQLTEITYKRRNGRQLNPLQSSKFDDGAWGWRSFSPRAQESLYQWEFDANGRVTAMIQQSPATFEEIRIPMSRALLFRLNPLKNNPEGKALLRGCFRAFFFKKRLQELEGIGIERDLAGLPVMYVDPQLLLDPANASTYAAYKQVITNLRRDEQEGVILPSVYDADGHRLYELTLLSTGSRRQSASNDVIERYNAEIAMSALSDFMLLGHTRTGAFALSKTKTDLFSTAFGYVLDVIGNEINEREVPRLLALNAMPGQCRLIHGKPGHVDVAAFSGMLLNLAKAGLPLASEDGARERFAFQQLGLPAGDVGNDPTRIPLPSEPAAPPAEESEDEMPAA